MANYINGYSTPRFLILDSNNNLINTIDLDLTNTDGLLESYKDESIIHVLDKDKEIRKVYRAGKKRIFFTFHYNEFFHKNLALNIIKILEQEENGYKIILIPRSDVLARRFEVVYSGDDFEIGLNKGGINAQSNKLLVLKWQTKRLEKPNWIDPDDIYCPFDFASL